ncbi:MAG: hypothetical protein R3B49_06155 [Phycisphaerales bacterium]
MGLDAVRAVLEAASQEEADELLDDQDAFFLVDHRADEDMIIEACEDVIRSGRLGSEVLKADNPAGFQTRMTFGSRSLIVPPSTDRHLAMVRLNELLAPDYEIRVCVDSLGDDTLMFAALAPAEWRGLESRFGPAAVARRFRRFGPSLNLWTGGPA